MKINNTCPVIMLLFSIAVAFIVFNNNDNNLNVARRSLCEQALLVGDISTFNEQNSKITSKAYKFKDFEYVDLKKKLLSAKDDIYNIESKIYEIHNAPQRAVLFVLLALNEYRKGDISKYNNCIARAYFDINSVSPVISEKYCIEIVQHLMGMEEKLPQEHAVDFIQVPYYSNNQVLLIYAMGGKKYCLEKIKNLLKNKQFELTGKRFMKYFQKAVFISEIKNMESENVERNFLYSAIEFSMTWKIKKWNNYKLPLLAYAYYIGGDFERFKFYRDKSVSKEQLDDMKASYYGYVEYSSKIFFLTGNPDISIKLLSTLKNGHKKNLLIKNLLQFMQYSRSISNEF